MKKGISLLLTVMLVLSLAACGQSAEPEGSRGMPGLGDDGSCESVKEQGSSDEESTQESADDGGDSASVYNDSLIGEMISEDGNYTFLDEEEYRYSYHVPKLIGESETIREINQEIDDSAGSLARTQIETLRDGMLFWYKSLNWSSFWQGSLLSLVICGENIDTGREYIVINYDFAEDRRLGNQELLERLGIEQETFYAALERTVMQEFDSAHRDETLDNQTMRQYYLVRYGEPGSLAMRAATLRELRTDSLQIYQEAGKCVCIAPFQSEGVGGPDWYFKRLEISPDTPKSPQKRVESDAVTAVLRDNRVYLSFSDKEEVRDHLLGYGGEREEGDYRLPGDDLPLGPGQEYEVQGLYSNYKDLFLGKLGYQEEECLFLITDQDTIEYVDILTGLRYGVFCAMSVPGRFDPSSFQQVEPEDPSDDSSRDVFVKDAEGEEKSLFGLCRGEAAEASPRGSWYSTVEEHETEGGYYSVIAQYDFSHASPYVLTVSELDELHGYTAWTRSIGMTEDGILCAFLFYSEETDAHYSGVLAYHYGYEVVDNRYYRTMYMTVVSGNLPYKNEGEEIVYYGSLSSEDDWSYEDYEDGDEISVVDPACLLGEWVDKNSGRCYLSAEETENEREYRILVAWGDGAWREVTWELTVTYDPEWFGGIFLYNNCVRKYVTYNQDGVESEEILNFDGTGSLYLADTGHLYWYDDSDAQSYGCEFTPFTSD